MATRAWFVAGASRKLNPRFLPRAAGFQPTKEVDDVVHLEGVGSGDEAAALELDDERLVDARFIDLVLETERLKNMEAIRRVARPIGVPGAGLLAGGFLDRRQSTRTRRWIVANRTCEVISRALPLRFPPAVKLA
jgi:hypothetical protein